MRGPPLRCQSVATTLKLVDVLSLRMIEYAAADIADGHDADYLAFSLELHKLRQRGNRVVAA